jgi:GT2 family glycosyltransferase
MLHPRWTITALTIPGREEYLHQLLESLNAIAVPGGARITVVYNKPIRDGQDAIEKRVCGWSRRHACDVFFNNGDPTISGGRNFQLNVCKTPLICFVDDDVTVHGDLFPALEHALRTVPAGIVGARSYVEESDTLFKPKDGTPHVIAPELRYMSVQGMLAAGYTNLFRDIGGFNHRRRFWGEWTELNLRMWRHGFPTGYVMDGGYLRHWEKAPESPTRNMEGRARHVLWGLICTAMEYDAVDISSATAAFWQLVEERYLPYSFGETLTNGELLRATLELLPELSASMPAIMAQRLDSASHPFDFKPFHPIDATDVQRVLPWAKKKILPYREAVWARPSATRRLLAGLWRKVRGGRKAPRG